MPRYCPNTVKEFDWGLTVRSVLRSCDQHWVEWSYLSAKIWKPASWGLYWGNSVNQALSSTRKRMSVLKNLPNVVGSCKWRVWGISCIVGWISPRCIITIRRNDSPIGCPVYTVVSDICCNSYSLGLSRKSLLPPVGRWITYSLYHSMQIHYSPRSHSVYFSKFIQSDTK